MKVKMLKLAASSSGVYFPDMVYDISPDLAKSFVSSGAAICLEEPKQVIETEEIEQEEKAVIKKGKKKKVK